MPLPSPADGPVPAREAAQAVTLEAVTKQYDGHRAVDEVDLDVRPGELFTLLGPSGSGKTTVLRLMAGLVEPTSGTLRIQGRDVSRVPTHRRDIGMVFQSHALFPHMTVRDNIAFPLKMRRAARADIDRQVARALSTVRLPDLGHRRVHELSGGQQQRVAFARALVYDPALLLLDEPLGALDRQLREEMQLEIVRLHRDVEVTIVNVTHDQREALMLSDRIGVMRHGRLEQVGPPEELYQNPRNRFVAEFLGGANLLDAQVVSHQPPQARLPSGQVLSVADNAVPTGSGCTVVLRPEVLGLRPDQDVEGEAAGCLAGTVALRAFEGHGVLHEVEVPGVAAPVRISLTGREHGYQVGTPVQVTWDPGLAQVLPLETREPGPAA